MNGVTDGARRLLRVVQGKQKPDEIPWDPIHKPSNADTLLEMLMEMYWDGVYAEVKNIIYSLIALQKEGVCKIETERKEQGKVVGFNSFIDQICEDPSKNNCAYVKMQYQEGGPHQPIHPLRTRAPPEGDALRKALGETLRELDDQSEEDILHFRARAMLQATGFLDIDKLVEYRSPDETFHVVRKGKVPQMKVEKFNKNGMPTLSPVRCKICSDIVRGVLFRCVESKCKYKIPLDPADSICEYCYHKHRHPQEHLVKIHKHCILESNITVDISQKLCKCTTVPRHDPKTGQLAALYPIDPTLRHRQTVDKHPKCRLFLLDGLVAEEKYRQLRDSMESRKIKSHSPSRSNRAVHEAVFASESRLEDDLDADIPWPLRPLTNKFPFGNTHISLMIGPLVIENGVFKPHQYQGVLVTKRDPLQYFKESDVDDDHLNSISIGYGNKSLRRKDERRIFTQRRGHMKERRLKACMKQVVGGAFSGYLDEVSEDIIVKELVTASRFVKDKDHEYERVRQSTEAVMDKMKVLLASRVVAILQIICARLFDKSVRIEWEFWTNNCQMFLDKILRYEDFGGIFGRPHESTGQPLYLMSFVVRNQSYDKAVVLETYDVPNGQTEEYLLSFRSGRHDDSDIIDTLHEYWHDWGAFGGPLYQHQDHFPWDCTEAYKTSAPTCNHCTLSQHVWAFPFDSWSIIQLALQKKRLWYASPSGTAKRLSNKEWFENRFKLFLARDILVRGAIAMTRTPKLLEACDWFRKSVEPRFDRLKLGGIHRAQPWSHHFEAGHFRIPYLAPWASLQQEYRIQSYEAMRLMRQRMTDVPPEEKAMEKQDMSTGMLLGKAEELMVPLAGVALFAEAAHLPDMPSATDAANAAAEHAQQVADAAAEIAAGVQALNESVTRLSEALGNITG